MKKFIFFFLIIIFSNLVKAGQEPVIRQFMTGNSIAIDSNRKVEDPVYIAGQLNNYQLYKCFNFVSLEINQDQISQCFFDTFSFWVDVELKGWDKNGVLTTKRISLNVTYDQRNGMEYKGIHTEKLENFYKTEIKILSLGNPTYRPFVKVSLEMAIERYRMINLSNIPSFNAITLNSTDGNIIFSWPNIVGAEEYDFEYTYIDDYKYISGNDYYDSTILSKGLNELFINFNKNASRITTRSNSVSIPNVFDRGYLVARFRAVTYTGAKFDHRITGRWSNESHGNRADQFVNNQEIFFVNSLEPTLNWQLVTTFAEEGKTKQVVSFMDGAYRSRQNITRISSDSTVIAAETIYDFQGRPAIQVLPVPLDNKKLEYYPDLNTDENTGTNYSAEHFDVGDCFVPSNGMVASSGAAKYYSANNEFLNNPNHYLSEHNPYIPDALKYPFTRTLYTPDNSGRVSIQSGVGRDHKIGSGHETRYYYGTPFQEELDRLFGNDVGFAKHYEKEMVVDPNGQVSVSYKDLSGKVIATALAGVSPDNVAKLSNNDNERELEVKLESSTETNLQDDYGLEITKSINVPLPTQYRISYSVLLDEFTKDCWTDCAECVYDLEVSIKDECGQEVVDGDPNTSGNQPIIRRLKKGTTGNFELDCGNLKAYSFINDPALNDTLRVNLLVGSYTLTKKIVVSNQAAEYFAQEYLNNATCLKTREDFVDYFTSIVDDFGCYISCDSCQELLANKGAYITDRIAIYVGQGFNNDTALYNIVEEEYYQKLEVCNSICDAEIPNCDYYKNILISDVSAGGQYQYLEGDITKHPEYCDYQYCLATNQAQNFEHYLDNIDYREALQNGLFDPLKTKGGTYPQGVYDTFFFNPANAALKTALINRINNFVSISGGTFRSIWDLAIYMSNEDLNGGYFGDAAIYEVISKYNHATRCLDKDVFLWESFRSFYKMARKEILDNHKNSTQCSTKIIPSGKERRFLTNDQITQLGPGTNETNQNNYFLETCQTYCDSMSYMWMQQIGDCVKNHPNWEQIRLGLVDVCQSSCNEDNPLGASENPTLNKSFKNVLIQYNVFDKHNCNPDVINLMPPSALNPLPISLSVDQLHCLCQEPNNPCMNNIDPDFYLVIKELKAFNDYLECEDFCYSCSEVREQIDVFNASHPESKDFTDSTKNWGGDINSFFKS